MDLFWAMFIFFILVTAVFVIITFLYPEIMGITGKKAMEIQKHQSSPPPESTPPPNDTKSH